MRRSRRLNPKDQLSPDLSDPDSSDIETELSSALSSTELELAMKLQGNNTLEEDTNKVQG